MSDGLIEVINIIEKNKSELEKFSERANKARKYFCKTLTNEILISPDTFDDSNFDEIIKSRNATLELEFQPEMRELRVPRGSNALSFVTRIQIETNTTCELELISTGTFLKRWMLTKDSVLQEYCAFPLTGARFSDIYFKLNNLGCSRYIQKIKVTLFGVVFGSKTLQLNGQEWAVAEEIYQKDTIVGSFPYFCLKNEILCAMPFLEVPEKVIFDRDRFSFWRE